MEELQLLVKMLADLPHMALWVIAAFWGYKVVVIGSVYGVIRFVVDRAYRWATTPKHTLEVKDVEIRGTLDGMTITKETDALVAQIRRLVGKGINIQTDYIHRQSIEWLREAIDEKMERESAAEMAKMKNAKVAA